MEIQKICAHRSIHMNYNSSVIYFVCRNGFYILDENGFCPGKTPKTTKTNSKYKAKQFSNIFCYKYYNSFAVSEAKKTNTFLQTAKDRKKIVEPFE